MEISIAANLSSDDCRKLSADDWKIVGAIMEEVNTIVDPYGALADDFGPLPPDHTPFDHLFGELTKNDDALAREIAARRGTRATRAHASSSND